MRHLVQKKALDAYGNEGRRCCKEHHFQSPVQRMIFIAIPPQMFQIVANAIKRSLINVGIEGIKRLFSFSHLPDSRKKTAGVDMVKISRFLIYDNMDVTAHLGSK